MKIMFVADTLGGGGKERRLVELIKGLAQNTNFELNLLILDGDLFYSEVLTLRCEVKRLYRGKGIQIHIYKQIKDAIRYFNPDIIHFWGEVGMTYLLPMHIYKKTPLVNSIIANTSPDNSFLKKTIRKFSFKYCNIILSNTYLGLKAYNTPVKKSKVIYNGFDFKRLEGLKKEDEIRSKFGITSDYIVTMIGAYSDRKDYETFLAATEKLIESKYSITIVTAGNGDYNYLKKFIGAKNLDSYRLLNFQDDIESLMNISTLGVLCSNSLIHGEGISNALLEFMALKKPIIATKDGGNIELIEEGKSGYMINFKDSSGLAKRIELLLNDESMRVAFGIRSREIVEEKFLINKMINSFTNLYKNIYSTFKY